MEQQQLLYFQTVARLNNMSQAARELHTTQPALSKSIRRLEEELGAPLFHRRGRQIILNELGEKMLLHTDIILDEMAKMTRLAEAGRQQAREVHVLAKAADQLIPDIVFAFHQEHPGVHVRISHYRTEDRDPDITITSAIEPYEGENGQTVLKEPFLFVVPADHPLALQETVTLEEVAQVPIVAFSPVIPLQDILLHWFREEGLEPKFSFECDTCAMARELILGGRSAGLVPGLSWSFPYSPTRKVIPVAGGRCYRRVNVIRSAAGQRSEVDAFYDTLVNYFEKLN